jgi:tetratricopeptide (TPR) repeat protein
MRKLTLLFSLLLYGSFFLAAQNHCSCKEFAALQTDNSNDSIIATQLIQSSSPICKAKGNQLMGAFYSNFNELDTAAYFLRTAEKLYKQSNCGDSILLSTYKSYAFIYYVEGDFAKAQEYSFKMLQAAEDAKNIYEQANCYTMIAQLFNQMGQAEKGITYARLAIPFRLIKLTFLKKLQTFCLNCQKDIYGIFKIPKRLPVSTVQNFLATNNWQSPKKLKGIVPSQPRIATCKVSHGKNRISKRLFFI